MPLYWFAAVSLHVLAAVAWIGGMVFLSTVLVPLLGTEHASSERVALFRIAARRFRIVVWLSILVLLSTGPVLLHARNVSLILPNAWPTVVRIKIALVIFLLLLTVAHDLFSGQHVNRIRAMPVIARTASDNVLVKASLWVPRLALIAGILVLLAAVVLARS
jgi:copper resistance protein D